MALAIVAVALGGGLRAMGQLTQSAQRLPLAVAAQTCLDNTLASLRLTGRRPAAGEQRSSCTQGRHTFAVVLQIMSTHNPGLMRIEAKVLDADGHATAQMVSLAGDG